MADETPAQETPEVNTSKYGCLIGITGLVMFTLVVIWTIYTGYTQNKLIDKFTQDEPMTLEVTYSDTETVFALRDRVRDFGKQVKEGKPSELKLSAQDLNDLIGHEDATMDFRKMVVFDTIDDRLKARVAMPLQTLFRGGKFRYLNAVMTFKIELESKQPMLEIDTITPRSGGEIPEGFLNYMRDNSNLLGTFKDHKQLSPILKRISSLKLEDGQVVVTAEGPQ